MIAAHRIRTYAHAVKISTLHFHCQTSTPQVHSVSLYTHKDITPRDLSKFPGRSTPLVAGVCGASDHSHKLVGVSLNVRAGRATEV